MARKDVLEFYRIVDGNKQLEQRVAATQSVEDLVILAGEHGFDLVVPELRSVSNLLGLIQTADGDADLQQKLGEADEAEVVSLGAAKGFQFSVDDVKVLTAERELSDGELEGVAGGALGWNAPGYQNPLQSLNLKSALGWNAGGRSGTP